MRKTLTAAAALAPLCFMLAMEDARATTTISNGRTTPVSTSTANNGAPDDINIDTGGSITLSSGTTPAVTLDSNNAVTNKGAIAIKDVNNAVGVLISGGYTGSFTNTGSITLNESHTPSDTNSDGVNEAPFATGTGRYGVRVQGNAPFVGNIVNDTGGTISVTGVSSYGISVETLLKGDLINNGSITLTGDKTVALNETGGVNGNVKITGAVTATGQGATAINLTGDVSGRFSLYSTATSTGYGNTSRAIVNSTQRTIQSTGSETQQGGSAVIIAGNVGQGVYIGAAPANTATGSTADVDGDGIADGSEGTGSITTFGSAPALLIGATGKSLTIGKLQFNPATSYGLVIAGTVSGAGIEDKISATGVQLGMSGGTLAITGGVSISGRVAATAYGDDSTGIHILSGTSLARLDVSGAVAALTAQPLPDANTAVATPHTGTSHAILIDAGASVPAMTVTGTISAETDGDGASSDPTRNSASAIVDKSGTLSTVNLTGHILALTVGSTSTTTPLGQRVALDLSNNTSGVTLTMNQAAQTITTVTTANGTSTTTVTTGGVVINNTGTAQSSSTTSGNSTITTTTPTAPTIVGDVYLGSGPNAVNINAGSITGALSLGSNSTASLLIDNGGSYSGALSYTGSGLVVNVKNGTLTETAANTLKASSLNVGNTGVLNFAIDPANNKAANFIVSGTATLAAGAKIGVNLLSNLQGPATYTLIKAGTLNSAAADSTLAADVPYLFYAAAQTNVAAGTLNLTIRPKTAQEMGLNAAESSALSAIYAGLQKDSTVQQIVFNEYQRAGFLKLYDQFLPDYAGGVFRAASQAARTISRITGEPNEIENPTGSRGAWAQQFFVGSYNDKTGGEGIEAGGFGFVTGVETGGLGFGAVGATLAFVAINNSDPYSRGDNRQSLSHLEGGFYWQGETGGLLFNARVAAGYDWLAARRQLVQTDSAGLLTLNHKTKASWSGYSLTGHAGASYQYDITPLLFVRPNVSVDYFRLEEGSYTERLGGDAFNLSYGDRTSDEASATASMIFGAKLGRGLVWRPQLELGARDIVSGGPGAVNARFAYGGPSFTIQPTDTTGLNGLARFKLKASTEYYEVGFEAGGEARSKYTEGDLKLTVRVLF